MAIVMTAPAPYTVAATPQKINTIAFFKQDSTARNIGTFDYTLYNPPMWKGFFSVQEIINKMNNRPQRPQIPLAHKQLDVTKNLYKGSPDFLNNFLGNGKLKGKGRQFYNAQNKYGINAIFLIAIAQLESACGKSKLARNNNNFGGMRNRKGQYLKFKTVDEGIDELASNLKRLYKDNGRTTIEQIHKIYAENPKWSDVVIDKMNEMRNYSQCLVLKWD